MKYPCSHMDSIHPYFPSVECKRKPQTTKKSNSNLGDLFLSYGRLGGVVISENTTEDFGMSCARQLRPCSELYLSAVAPSLPVLSGPKDPGFSTENKFNTKYMGNQLSSLTIQDQVLLVCTQGELHNDLGVHKLTVDKVESKLHLSEEHSIDSGPIYQITSTQFNDTVFSVTRNNIHTNLVSIHPHTLATHTLHTQPWLSTPTHVAMNPYLRGEYITMLSSGMGHLSNAQGDVVTTIKTRHRFPCSSDQYGANFGMHPKEVLVYDCTGLQLVDTRGLGATLDLLSLPHKALRQTELLRVSRPARPQYHWVATDDHLLLMDQRFPGHPVLHWRHLLDAPPVYCEQGRDCQAVLVGGRKEVHCWQEAETQGHPQWVDVPWRIARCCDFAKLMAKHGVVLPKSAIMTRLDVPIWGITAAPVETGFTCFQMTSFGDLFYQTYTTGNSRQEKTCSFGPGSQQVQIPREVQDRCKFWLDQLEQLMNRCSTTIVNKGRVSEDIDITKLAQEISGDYLPHRYCKLCKNGKTTASYTGDHCTTDTCTACGHTVLEAAETFETSIKKTIASVIEVPDMKELGHLDGLDPDSVTDKYGQVVISLWKGQTVDKELVRQRDEVLLNQLETSLKRNTPVTSEAASDKIEETSLVQEEEETDDVLSALALLLEGPKEQRKKAEAFQHSSEHDKKTNESNNDNSKIDKKKRKEKVNGDLKEREKEHSNIKDDDKKTNKCVNEKIKKVKKKDRTEAEEKKIEQNTGKEDIYTNESMEYCNEKKAKKKKKKRKEVYENTLETHIETLIREEVKEGNGDEIEKHEIQRDRKSKNKKKREKDKSKRQTDLSESTAITKDSRHAVAPNTCNISVISSCNNITHKERHFTTPVTAKQQVRATRSDTAQILTPPESATRATQLTSTPVVKRKSSAGHAGNPSKRARFSSLMDGFGCTPSAVTQRAFVQPPPPPSIKGLMAEATQKTSTDGNEVVKEKKKKKKKKRLLSGSSP